KDLLTHHRALAADIDPREVRISKVRDPHAIKKHLLKHAQKALGAKMGDKSHKVVVKCLKGDFKAVDNTKEDLKLQQAISGNVVYLFQRSANST
ncbi:hypothetical protein GCG54_00012625, partial [Colletotrichum gloeosporioides]